MGRREERGREGRKKREGGLGGKEGEGERGRKEEGWKKWEYREVRGAKKEGVGVG